MDSKQFNITKLKMKFSKGFIVTIIIILIVLFMWAILTKTGYIKNYFDIQCLKAEWTKEKLTNKIFSEKEKLTNKIFSENVKIFIDRNEYFINSIVSELVPVKVLNKSGTIIYHRTACDVKYSNTLNTYRFQNNEWKNITSPSFCAALGSTYKIKHNKEDIFYFRTKGEGRYKIGFPFSYNGKNFEKFSEPFTVKRIETTLENSLNICKDNKYYNRSCLKKVGIWVKNIDTDSAIEVCNMITKNLSAEEQEWQDYYSNMAGNCFRDINNKIARNDIDKAIKNCNGLKSETSLSNCLRSLAITVSSIDPKKSSELCNLSSDALGKMDMNCYEYIISNVIKYDITEAIKICWITKTNRCFISVSEAIAVTDADRAIEICELWKNSIGEEYDSCYFFIAQKVKKYDKNKADVICNMMTKGNGKQKCLKSTDKTYTIF